MARVAPENFFVWCFSHILNLVIYDTDKNPVEGNKLFFKES
jgi:hypothetical protein